MTTTLLLALTLTAGAAQAQSPAAAPSTAQVDARLDSWLGCWRLDEDLGGTGARMCITPEQGGVRLQTIVGVQKGINEIVIPDGVARSIVDAECKGTERAEWSQDGMRLFRTTEVTCNKETPRTIQSVAFLANGPAWVNVQYVSGQLASNSVRVQRYRRSPNQNLADGSQAAQPTMKVARKPGDTAWGVDDVIEASGKLPAEALQAALTEVRQPFSLDSKTLIAMDKAEVPDSVIDLMVALTFPKRFVVERAGGGGGSTAMGISTGGGFFDPFMSPSTMGVFNDCYSPSGYGYRSYYSMCGSYYSAYNYGYYPYGGNYYGNNGYWNNGGWVAVNPPGVIVTPGPDATEGRVVNGRGYTQIRRSEPEASVSRGSNRGDGSAAGYAGASGASSGGSSGVSSGGYSSGSSGSSGGSSGGGSSSGGDSGARTAVPRPPGGM